MPFHRFYFELRRNERPVNTTIVAPNVRLLGENAAMVNYVRLVQSVDDNGKPVTRRFEETRVWERQGGAWRHVHFHRSQNG
jgi:calcium/calmodulin-dependent protein kinase (CaM kinase) II